MALTFNNTEIRKACGSIAFNRGMAYLNDGRVQSLDVTKELYDLLELNGRVRGSGERVYQQHIVIQRRKRGLTIHGDCSCPVGYNCKHVVAVCLYKQVQERNRPRLTAQWLNELKQSEAVETDLAPGRTFLFYLLKFERFAQAVIVEPVSARIKKDGSIGVPRATGGELVGVQYHHYRLPAYVAESDKPILHLLDMIRVEYGRQLLKGRSGFTALEQMLATGRCFYESLDEPLRYIQQQRNLQLDWVRTRGGLQLTPKVEPRALLIPTDPPCWLDSGASQVGPLDISGFAGLSWEKLLDAPLLPEEEVGQFTALLLMEFPDLPIPPPVEVPVEDIEGRQPVPCLTLEVTQTGEIPYRVRLDFDYGPCTVSAGDHRLVVVMQGENILYRLYRNQEAESLTIAKLEEAGFEPGGDNGGFLPTHQSAGIWQRFLKEVLPKLEGEGWRITTMEGFQPRFFDESTMAAVVEEDDAGWFDLRFDLDIDGQKVPLLPLLVPMLQRMDKPDQIPSELTVPLGDQRFLTLKAERLRPFLETLYELFDTEAKEEALRLSHFDAARLAELEEDAQLTMKGAERLRRLGRRLSNFQGLETVEPPKGLNCQLRPYQQFGLSWLQFLREYELGGILADDMGLGKTVQTLAHLLLEKEGGRLDRPALVVAPTSLMGNWRRESERFAPQLNVLVLHGPDRHERFDRIGQSDLVLTTYPLLSRDEEVLKPQQWSFVILDEAQTVKNPKTKAARALRRLRARHKLCLTGTPLENHLGELWALFDFLMPGFLGSEEQFKRLYRTPVEKHGDEDVRRRLVRRIAPFLLRRTKSEVEKDLPPKTEIVRTVELYPNQAALYESIRVAMEKKVREAVAAKGLARSQIAILDALLKLRQACCHPRLVKLSKARNLPSAKLDLLAQMLPELLEEGRRILLFSQFTSMLTLIEEVLGNKGIGYTKLTGKTRKRDEAIEHFKSGEVNLFLISLKAGGVGLNLTEADTVILYDPWWNPAVEAQAMDRAHRIGQDKPVFVYKLMTENTVEERILKLQAKKQALAEGIYGKGGKLGPALSADDLKELLAPLG